MLEFLEQVKYDKMANMTKDPRYKVRFVTRFATYLKEKPIFTESNVNDAVPTAVDAEFAVVNTEDTATIAVEIIQNPTTVKQIEVVSSPVIKVEKPYFLLSSSPGQDVESMQLQVNEMND
ncbi:hypothetical protein BB560_007136 [Smittium megazygosporum]|uniref:Uncharacterized protein n=1 Tax=Smittium megazygosporum TaxID=133381 RepID=A0A2T9XYD5_9FUNG|nr:hypothetical protein BB560_007136 [Smittium megazygosporum]